MASTARSTRSFGRHDLDLHLGQEIDDVFRTAVELGMALLPAEAFGLRDRDALDAHFLQRLFHFVEFERLDDRFDLLHREFRLECVEGQKPSKRGGP